MKYLGKSEQGFHSLRVHDFLYILLFLKSRACFQNYKMCSEPVCYANKQHFSRITNSRNYFFTFNFHHFQFFPVGWTWECYYRLFVSFEPQGRNVFKSDCRLHTPVFWSGHHKRKTVAHTLWRSCWLDAPTLYIHVEHTNYFEKNTVSFLCSRGGTILFFNIFLSLLII